jgi:hypothetical protein
MKNEKKSYSGDCDYWIFNGFSDWWERKRIIFLFKFGVLVNTSENKTYFGK